MTLFNTRRYLDVVSTIFKHYGRRMDVETKLCASWGSKKLKGAKFEIHIQNSNKA